MALVTRTAITVPGLAADGNVCGMSFDVGSVDWSGVEVGEREFSGAAVKERVMVWVGLQPLWPPARIPKSVKEGTNGSWLAGSDVA